MYVVLYGPKWSYINSRVIFYNFDMFWVTDKKEWKICSAVGQEFEFENKNWKLFFLPVTPVTLLCAPLRGRVLINTIIVCVQLVNWCLDLRFKHSLQEYHSYIFYTDVVKKKKWAKCVTPVTQNGPVYVCFGRSFFLLYTFIFS